MADVKAEGMVEEVTFTSSRSDGLFTIGISVDGKTTYFQVVGLEASLTADGGTITYPDLMCYLAGAMKPVRAVLYQRPERYMAVLKADFTEE